MIEALIIEVIVVLAPAFSLTADRLNPPVVG